MPVWAELPTEATILAIESASLDPEELITIQKGLGLVVGGSLDPRRVNEGIVSLYKQGKWQSLFVETTPKGKGVVVTIRGARLRMVRRVVYDGVDAEIVTEVRPKVDLEEGSRADFRSLGVLRERLRQAYEARGIYGANIVIELNDIAGTTDADVEVTVKPGKNTLVSRVSLGGASPEELVEMRKLITLQKGQPFSTIRLNQDLDRIRTYLKSNHYPTSKIDSTVTEFSEDKSEVAVNVLLKMGERYQFQFVGNTLFTEVALREVLTDEVLNQSDSYSRVSRLIKVKYKAVGFHFCDVQVKENKNEVEGLSIVRFVIDEGPKVIIDKVEFTSLEEMPESRLRFLFFEDAPGVLQRHLYWEEGIKDAVVRLTRKLELMGYLKANVSPPRTLFTEDKKGVSLLFDVELGTQTRVSGIEILGTENIPKERLQSLLPFRLGGELNREQVEEGKKALLAYYANEGFIDAKIGEGKSNLTLSADSKGAVVHYVIEEGKQYFVGAIRIDGLRKTKEIVVQRELRLKTGDRYSPSLVRQSEENVSTLGLFARVEILSASSKDSSTTKDLVVVVRETQPGLGEIGLGGVYEDPRFRLRPFFSIEYRNLGGLNQTASMRNEISFPISKDTLIPFIEYSSVIGYRAPYPFALPFTFSGQIGLDRFEVSTNGPKVQTRARIEGRIEKRLSQRVLGVYRLLRYEFTKSETLSTGDETKNIIGSTGPGLIVDLRDDVFNPSRGTYHTLDVEFASPIFLSQSDISFLMALSRNSIYVPFISPFKFTIFVGAGYAKSLFPDRALPASRRETDLALGGQGSIRGFGVRRFLPGGDARETAYYNLRSEISVPLFAELSAAIFFDTGRIFPNLTANLGFPRHDGVGVGFRYKTPVGPIVIDVAQGLGDDKENVKFYFTVGTL